MKKERLSNAETEKIFLEAAKEEAKRVCGNGRCIACFKCGHENKDEYTIPKFGKGEQCPLEKYGVEPDGRSFAERLKDGEKVLTPQEELNNLSYICACCEHSQVVTPNGDYELDISDDDFAAYCLDCPVHQAIEGIEENMAEALNS